MPLFRRLGLKTSQNWDSKSNLLDLCEISLTSRASRQGTCCPLGCFHANFVVERNRQRRDCCHCLKIETCGKNHPGSLANVCGRVRARKHPKVGKLGLPGYKKQGSMLHAPKGTYITEQHPVPSFTFTRSPSSLSILSPVPSPPPRSVFSCPRLAWLSPIPLTLLPC